MKKTSKFKSKKYPRLKKYLYGDTVESAAITEQKRQQEELNAQARQDKNAATAAKGAGAALGAYSAYQSGQSGPGNKAQKDAASYEGAIDSFAGTALPWYTLAKQGSDLATSAVPQKTITNKETGEVVTDYSGTSGKQAAAVFKPHHEMAVEDLSSGNTGLAVAEMFLPGLGYESRSNALGMQKGINKLFGSEENDAAANFAKAEAANKAYDEQQKQAYDAQQAQQKEYNEQMIRSGIDNYYGNPNQNKNQSQTFAMGGVPQMPNSEFEKPNSEVQGGEIITSKTPPKLFSNGGIKLVSNNPYSDPTYETKGPGHDETNSVGTKGMPTLLKPGSIINGLTPVPDFMANRKGETFDKHMKKHAIEENKIVKLSEKFSKKAQNGDKYSKNASNVMLPILDKKLKEFASYKDYANNVQNAIIANKEQLEAINRGELPPQGMPDQSQGEMVMARYGAQMKYRMGGMQMLPKYDDGGPLLSPEGYKSINQFENTVGTYDKNTGLPVSMNAGDQYAQTGGSSNAVKEIEDYIDSSIGRDAWDKLPDNIKTQMYDAMFNSGGANKDYYMRGLAQAIYNSDPNSKNYGITGKDQRNALDLNESFNTIKNASYSNDDIYNNFVGIRGEQLSSIGKKSKFPDAYMPTYSSRAKSIDANYINNSAANKPVTPGVPVNPSAPQTATQQPAYNNIYPRMSPSPFITKQEQNQLSWEDMNRRGQANELAATGQQPQAATPPVAQTPSYNNIYPRVSTTPSPFITPRESDRLQYENDVRKVTEQGMAAKKAGKKPPPDPKDYSNYKDYAREAAIFAGQNLGNISDLIRTRGGRKYDKESYGQMTPQMPDFTEAKRNAKSEASAYRRMLPGLTGGNAGATLGMMGQLQGLSQQALAKIVEGEQQARTGVYNQFLPLNKQLQMQERADTQANKARSEDIARMATSGIADTIGGAGLDYGMYKNQKEQFALIKNAYPDYDYNERKKAWYHKDTKEKLDPTKVQAATKATK